MQFLDSLKSRAACRCSLHHLSIPLLLCFAGCSLPDLKGEKKPPQIGPISTTLPKPNSPRTKPVDRSEPLTPVKHRTVIYPEKAITKLNRTVSLDSRGGPLSQVIRKWSNDSGINVAVHSELFKDGTSSRFPVWLKIHRMPAKGALEWICRLCNISYIVSDGVLWLVPDYRWVASETAKSQVDLIGGLYSGDGSDLHHFLSQALRVFLNFHPSCRLTFNPRAGQLLAVLPRSGTELVGQVISELQTHAPFRVFQDQLPTSITIPPAPPPPIQLVDRDEFSRRMKRVTKAIYKETDVQDILADLIDRTGINIAFDYRKIPESRRKLTFSLGFVTADRLLRELVKRCYLKRIVVEPDRGIWLYPETQIKNAPATHHQSWQRVLFRSYPARVLVPRKSGGKSDKKRGGRTSKDRLLNFVMERIKGNWSEPAYAIGYNQPTGRLLLLHERHAHLQIPSVLAAYKKTLKLTTTTLTPPGGNTNRPRR